jgi:SAM-dependent methyltransferase
MADQEHADATDTKAAPTTVIETTPDDDRPLAVQLALASEEQHREVDATQPVRGAVEDDRPAIGAGGPSDSDRGALLLTKYHYLYDIPQIRFREAHLGSHARPATQDFVTVCPSGRSGNPILTDTTQDAGYILPTRTIGQSETVIDAARQAVETAVNTRVMELRPVASVVLETAGRSRPHYGICFAAVVDQSVTSLAATPGVDPVANIGIESLPWWQARLLRFSADTLDRTASMVPEAEVESAADHQLAHWVNKHVVSPLVGGRASRAIEDQVLEVIDGSPGTILDPACGDDELVFTLEETYDPVQIVANDISWETMDLLREQQPNSNVLFTNHNILELPFSATFDLTVFKNTLHHIPESEQRAVVKQLAELSNQLIIVDVDDPRNHSLKSRLWNTYYRRVLGDQGEDFLSYAEFRSRLEEWLDCEVRFGTIETIKGRYYYADIG